jgi:lambda repressor-like predicted transcriptional regulator
MKVAMTLTGAKTISEISRDSLVQELSKLPAALAPLSGKRGLNYPSLTPLLTRPISPSGAFLCQK